MRTASVSELCFRSHRSRRSISAQPGSERVEFRRAPDKIDVDHRRRSYSRLIISILKSRNRTSIRSAPCDGIAVTRDFPIGNQIPPEHAHDNNLEPHQRGMYFSHGSVDGIDYWGEAAFSKYSDDAVFGRKVA